MIRTLGQPGVSFLFARKTSLIIENYIFNYKEVKAMSRETEYFDNLFNELFNEEKAKELRKEQVIKKYVDIVNNVIDKKRDEKISRELSNGVNLTDLVKIIDKHEEMKKEFEEKFRSSVVVKTKGEH